MKNRWLNVILYNSFLSYSCRVKIPLCVCLTSFYSLSMHTLSNPSSGKWPKDISRSKPFIQLVSDADTFLLGVAMLTMSLLLQHTYMKVCHNINPEIRLSNTHRLVKSSFLAPKSSLLAPIMSQKGGFDDRWWCHFIVKPRHTCHTLWSRGNHPFWLPNHPFCSYYEPKRMM